MKMSKWAIAAEFFEEQFIGVLRLDLCRLNTPTKIEGRSVDV